jgi:hypothetical protein
MKASNVIFDEVEHTYHLNGKKLQGITGTLIPHAIGKKYADVPDSILIPAMEKGKRVHSEIEMYLQGFEPSEPTDEFLAFKKWQSLTKIKFIQTEFIVSDNENFATPIDAIDEDYNLYDWKTTYFLDLEYLSWQLSICAYFSELIGNKVKKLYTLHLRGKNEPNLVKIERKPNSEVQRLIECYLKNEPYVSTLALSNEETLAKIYELEKMLVEIESEAKRYKTLKEQMSEFLTKQMESSGVKTFETENLKVTRVLPSETTTFDAKALLADMPELAEKYNKTSVRKGYLKLTIKK